MPDRYWPLAGLRLTTERLTLRPWTEADLELVSDTLPADLALDPAAPRFDLGDEQRVRGVMTHQDYWRQMGSWTPQEWRLTFLVHTDGQFVGCQGLEGSDFPHLRTVDSSSFLVPGARGRGLGKDMRRAVLALAFGPLGALAAITSAWHHNRASLGVSRALGYQPNGESLHRRDDDEGVDTMVHLRLLRADWLASGLADGVAVTGVEACLPFFGLDGALESTA